jgi:hypothetical protein
MSSRQAQISMSVEGLGSIDTVPSWGGGAARTVKSL